MKLVLTRRQMFGPVGGRPRTEQRVTFGATQDGALTAIRHHSKSTTSTIEDWVEPATTQTRMLYACPNVETQYDLVRVNVGSPTFMRAPGESTGTFALESAMDELAYALGMDPLALRLQELRGEDPESGKPWSSKALRECYAVGGGAIRLEQAQSAAALDARRRWLVGWGMATATYPARRAPAGAIARMMPDGRVWVRAGTQEIGCGTYTVDDADRRRRVRRRAGARAFELGEHRHARESRRRPAPSRRRRPARRCTTSRWRSRQKLVQLAIADARSPLHGAVESNVKTENGRPDRRRFGERRRYVRGAARPKRCSARRSDGGVASWCRRTAVLDAFVRRGVHRSAGRSRTWAIVRVPRVVTAHAVGRILNAKTARSQITAASSGASGWRSRRKRTSIREPAVMSTPISPSTTCR